MSTAGRYLDEQRQDFQTRMDAKLRELDGKISQLRAQAAKQTGSARADLDRRIQGLEKQRSEAGRELDELKRASSDGWQKLKGGAEKAVDDLDHALGSKDR